MNVTEFLTHFPDAKKSGKGWMAKCPAHDDGTASLSISEVADGRILIHCHAGCQPEAVCAAVGLTLKDLYPPRTASTAPPAKPRIDTNGESLDWQKCVAVFTETAAQKLAAERGLSIEFVRWLHAQGMVGIFEGKIAFANHGDGGAVVSAHVRLGGKPPWMFKPAGHKVAPLVFGDTEAAGFILAFESQFDAFAVMDKLGWHTANGLPDTAVFITRGAGNGKLIHGKLAPHAVCYAFKQNDAPTPEKPTPAGDIWLAEIASNAGCKVLSVATPAPHKDANDWTRAGANEADLRAAMKAAMPVQPKTAPVADSNRADIASEYLPGATEAAQPETTPGRLTLRKPDEILAMMFDDSDIYLAERLLADGQPLVIAAQGGAGKSRLALQLVAAIVCGRDFIGFKTGKPKSRWLFLQTENTNRRLKFDLENVRRWLGDDWQKFNDQVVIHTLENDTDGFVNLDSLENQAAITAAIEDAKPDGIVVDPLNEFSIGDLNKDVDMRATLQALSRICKKGNPLRAIVTLHHALTGRGGAVKVTGHDRASFARNSKVMHAWTRGQINIAPIDPDNNERLIVACGKCSNGKEFEKFAIKLDPETFIYERDNTVDLSQWEQEMTGEKTKRTASPELVRELAEGKPKKAELVKRIMVEIGCGKSAAYDAIDRAERRKLVHYSKALKIYEQSV
jgi:hypothetical protein